jgi:hypothetical protein
MLTICIRYVAGSRLTSTLTISIPADRHEMTLGERFSLVSAFQAVPMGVAVKNSPLCILSFHWFTTKLS